MTSEKPSCTACAVQQVASACFGFPRDTTRSGLQYCDDHVTIIPTLSSSLPGVRAGVPQPLPRALIHGRLPSAYIVNSDYSSTIAAPKNHQFGGWRHGAPRAHYAAHCGPPVAPRCARTSGRWDQSRSPAMMLLLFMACARGASDLNTNTAGIAETPCCLASNDERYPHRI